MCGFRCTGTSFPWINLFLIFHSLGALVCVCACSVVSYSLQPHGLQPARLHCPWNSPGQNTGVGCHFLLQGIFPTWESNPSLMHLLHWWILYHCAPWEAPDAIVNGIIFSTVLLLVPRQCIVNTKLILCVHFAHCIFGVCKLKFVHSSSTFFFPSVCSLGFSTYRSMSSASRGRLILPLQFGGLSFFSLNCSGKNFQYSAEYQ